MQESERGVNLEQGETITLIASGARTATAGTNGTAVAILGERERYIFILAVTAAATDVDDTLDVYVDWSIDNVTYYNGGHLPRYLVTVELKAEYMVFDATTPGTSAMRCNIRCSIWRGTPAVIWGVCTLALCHR